MRDRFVARFARSLVLAAVAVVAAHSSAGAQEIDCNAEGDREVRSVRFEGNEALGTDALSARVLTTPSTFTQRYFGWFFGAGVERCLPNIGLGRDVAALRQYYQDNGFYLAKIDTLVAPVGDRSVNVTFRIDEGRPSIIDSLSIVGLDSVENRDGILRDLQLRLGGRFGRLQLATDIDSITARLRNAGYLRATVFRGFDAGPKSPFAQVFLTVVPGERAKFGTIAVQRTAARPGREPGFDSSVVLGLLGFQPGNYYSDRALADAQRNLYNLGAFRHVGIDVDTTRAGPDSIADVVVDLREDFLRQYSQEEGWATLDCFRINSQYSDKNFADRAWRLDLTGRVSKLGYGKPLANERTRNLCWRPRLDEDSVGSSRLNYYLGASIRQPTLFGGHWVPAYSVYTERRSEYRVYLRTTYVGGDVSATRNIGDRMPLRLGYSMEYGQTEAEPAFLCVLFAFCNRTEQERIQQRLPFAVASASFQRNRADNAVEPRSGYVFGTEGRLSQHFLGSDSELQFYRLTADFSLYRPVTSRITFASRVRAGFVTGGRTANTNLPPPQERLYAGGANSVRGFQQNELGALVYVLDNTSVDSSFKGPAGSPTWDSVAYFAKPDAGARRTIPVGGTVLTVINTELRIRDPFFPELIEYVPFVDAGQLFTEGSTSVSNVKRLFITPGMGIRYFSPVGPIQGNVGYNPSRVRAGQAFFTPEGTGNRRPLVCATASGAPLFFMPVGAAIENGDFNSNCPPSFTPFRRNNFFSKLTLTLSIGTSF
jgi:outer membrane protein insertion porin family/translocation and assembly module TamA